MFLWLMFTKEEWLDEAHPFIQAFCTAYRRKQVMTYMHIFVYHYGFFLQTYHSIKKFVNYALKGKHQVMK